MPRDIAAFDCIGISLRWHYPNQVAGRDAHVPSQPPRGSSPLYCGENPPSTGCRLLCTHRQLNELIPKLCLLQDFLGDVRARLNDDNAVVHLDCARRLLAEQEAAVTILVHTLRALFLLCVGRLCRSGLLRRSTLNNRLRCRLLCDRLFCGQLLRYKLCRRGFFFSGSFLYGSSLCRGDFRCGFCRRNVNDRLDCGDRPPGRSR